MKLRTERMKIQELVDEFIEDKKAIFRFMDDLVVEKTTVEIQMASRAVEIDALNNKLTTKVREEWGLILDGLCQFHHINVSFTFYAVCMINLQYLSILEK